MNSLSPPSAAAAEAAGCRSWSWTLPPSFFRTGHAAFSNLFTANNVFLLRLPPHQINALCMEFYARSEEARQSHSVHKLALSALALEDALSKGLPIEKEIGTVRDHLESIDKDSLIALVLSSLLEDTQKNGTDTLSQLNHKFDAMKGTLRHFSLIPPSGGGILSHSLAQVASWLKDLLQFMDGSPSDLHVSHSHKRPRESSKSPIPHLQPTTESSKYLMWIEAYNCCDG